MSRKPDFKLKPATERLLPVFTSTPPGEVLTWEAISEVLGFDGRTSEGRDAVHSVRRILRRRNRIVFFSVEGVGYRRLTDGQAADILPRYRTRKARRQQQVMMEEIQAIKTENLTPKQQAEVTAALARAGVILHFTNLRFVEKQQAEILKNQPQLPPPLKE